jgi:cobyrinic acid a,c-diamide synthase
MGSHARVVVAGTSGDSGKTLVSLGLVAAWRRVGRRVAAFKKGPDYIDAAWLGWAAERQARNLDVFLMGEDTVKGNLAWHARDADLTLIEGNRGLYDGLDAAGSASTARLAALVRAPVVLVLSAAKMTATAAAMVRGCETFDPTVRIGGVIVNRVSSPRHGRIAAGAIEASSNVPVLGVVPRLDDELLPSRHLGLVPPTERGDGEGLHARLAEFISQHVDVAKVEELARSAPPLPIPQPSPAIQSAPVRIGYFNDSAFTFYYPENLESLERAGAILEPISALAAQRLPPLDLLYIGGGFPETHAARLSANQALREAVRTAARAGLPIYAECGGLMYLAASVRVSGRDYPMSGVLPIDVETMPRPQGHGYCELTVDGANPFFPVGTTLRGHEFHYSRVTSGVDDMTFAYRVTRGTGCGHQRDGMVAGNVLASYTHLHAAGVPGWADNLYRCALAHQSTRREEDAASEESREEGRQDGRGCGGDGGSRDLPAPSTVSG